MSGADSKLGSTVVGGRDDVPAVLADRQQWLVWKFEQRPGDKKPRKVPYYVNGRRRSGGNGSPADRAELVVLDEAWQAVASGRYSGLGFAFLPDDGLVGVDLDGSIDEHGEIRADHRLILQSVRTYTELSPSKRGYHLIALADTSFPHKKNHKSGVECFYGKGFFTFTVDIAQGRNVVATAPDNLVDILGLTKDRAKPVSHPVQRSGDYPETTIDDVREMLGFISPDLGYDDWIKVGRILLDEFGMEGAAEWDRWSSGGSGYPGPGAIQDKIASFVKAPGGSVATLGTLVVMAKEGGWKPARKSRQVDPRQYSDAEYPELNSGTDDQPADPGDDAPEEVSDLPRSPSGQGGANQRGMRVPSLVEVIDHFALIYGTDTVFDGMSRKVMRLTHLREAIGPEVYKLWRDSSERLVVRGIVFDPAGQYDENEYVNLYDGLNLSEVQATEESVKPILQHIHWMAGGNEEVYRWLVKWIAYPLQNPGAKMQSSIINYGAEGTGKSFLWEQVVKRMYGRYGITVGQAQLESTFTTWKSHKLFVVAEEVVSRAEKAHYKGQLKHMVTGDKHIINEKNLPEREEDNLMNFVFLSNNTQPLELDYGDRRYLALFMGEPKPKQYYADLGAWIENGGVELFYNWLKSIPLGDFSPHTQPPMTEAKESLIDMSMPSPQYFYRQWVSGDLPVPVGPVVNDDLYMVYQRWCEKSREYVMSHRKFSGEIKRFMKQERVDIQHPEPESPRKTKRVWVPDDWRHSLEVSRVEAIQNACQAAHVEVGRYHKGEAA